MTHLACKAPLFTDAPEFVPCSLPCCPAAHARPPPLETSLQGRGQGLGRLPSTLPQLTLSAKDVCLGRPGGSPLPTSVWTQRKPRRGLWSCDSSKHVPPGQMPGRVPWEPDATCQQSLPPAGLRGDHGGQTAPRRTRGRWMFCLELHSRLVIQTFDFATRRPSTRTHFLDEII